MTDHQSPHSHATQYRADIDGLRAVAVFFVVAFHAFPEVVKGGFVGVDIFFVISGFLISTILFKNFDNNSFTFRDFYIRRVRRIFPALALVLAFCLVVGWHSLLAEEYSQLGKHVAAGALFVSNLVLWRESGYFDVAAETKPFLHLWSLGIEEQFYIVWPFLLWLAWRQKFNFLPLILLLLVVSCALNVSGVKFDATATFYSPISRFWQLLCGSLLAWLTLYRAAFFQRLVLNIERLFLRAIGVDVAKSTGRLVNHLISAIGLALIVNAVYRLNSSYPYPGKWALLPTMGALLLIAGSKDAWINRNLLSQRWLIWFGIISYPLYLWHWPLLTFARIINNGAATATMRWIIVAVSIVLAWLTCRFVEQPLRFGRFASAKTTCLVAVMAVLALTGLVVSIDDGFKFRTVVQTNVSKESAKDGGDMGQTIAECGIQNSKEKALFYGCRMDKREIPRFALWGDSKAGAIVDGIYRTSFKGGRWLYIGGNGPSAGTVPVISDSPIFSVYQGVAKIALRAIMENTNIERVLLVAATRALFQLKTDFNIEDLPASNLFDTALDGLDNVVTALIQSKKQVVLLVDNPTLAYPEDCLKRKTTLPYIQRFFDKANPRCTISVENHLKMSAKYRKLLETVQERHPQDVKIFDTLSYLCDTVQGVCNSFMDGRMLYGYTDHISDYAAGKIGRDLNRVMMDIW